VETQYINQTFTFATPNLTVNGMPVETATYLATGPSNATSDSAAGATEQYEPFDGRKRQRVEELAREEEDLLREIAALKRQVPSAAASAYADAMRDAMAADEEVLRTSRAEALSKAEEEVAKQRMEIRPLERQASVEKNFASAVVTLERMKKDMPATVAKMERARVAGEYVITQR
jgi:kinetochor protein Mis14/NSL1